MHLVGSEALSVVDGTLLPAGRRHAVGPAQRALCSGTRPRFLWPALAWDALLDVACPTCAAALRPAAEPYPAEAAVDPRAALMRWEPSPGLFETPGTIPS